MCWRGTVAISGVASGLRRLDCAGPHAWETFAAGRLPSDALDVDQDTLLGHAAIASVCSASTRGERSVDPGRTTDWRIDAWPDQLDAGTWIFHCLARSSEGATTGSAFGGGG